MPGIFPSRAVLGLVTCNSNLAKEIDTYQDRIQGLFDAKLETFLSKNRQICSPYRDQEAYLHREEDDTKEGSHASNEIKLVDLPDQDCSIIVD